MDSFGMNWCRSP